jgi:transcriptional regulator of acetoin/glycerol metabolism
VEALSHNDMLRVPPALSPPVQSVPARPHHLAGFGPTAPLDEVVRAHVAAAIQAHGGNRAAAARALGVGRNTLWRWIKGGRGACNRTGASDRKVSL